VSQQEVQESVLGPAEAEEHYGWWGKDVTGPAAGGPGLYRANSPISGWIDGPPCGPSMAPSYRPEEWITAWG